MEEDTGQVSFTISRPFALKAFLGGNLILIVLLVLADVVFNYLDVFDSLQIRRIFNIAKEGSVPSFVSILLLLLIAIFAYCHRLLTLKNLNRPQKYLWMFVALFFLFLATDDAAQIHERLGSFFRRQVTATSFTTELHWGEKLLNWHGSFSWHVAVLPFFALAGMAIFSFLWFELGDLWGRMLLVLGILCFVLAVGLDYLEGLDDFYVNLGKRFYDTNHYFYNHFAKVVEECLEMSGAVLLSTSLLRHLLNNTPRVDLLIQD